MVSLQQLLIYGSPVVVAIAFLLVQYPDWVSFASLESLDQLGSFLANLLSDTNIFVLSAAYARWALPWPWASRESTQLKTVAAVSVGLVAKWNVEAARKASYGATSDMGPCRYLLFHYWPLCVAHMNSYLFTAILTDIFAVAMLAGWQVLILTLYFTVWWHPLADMLFRALDIFLPVSEVASAFQILREVVGKEDFDCCAAELFIVVSYVQISLGYVNIWYMRQDKARSNALLDVASGKLAARQFLTQRVLVYVSSVALPYMFQRSIMETANSASFRHFFNKVEESLRVDSFLHAGENPHNRLEVVRDSNYTVDGYTESFNHLIHTCYNMIEGKLWELPNLVLLSGMLFGQPLLTLTLLPVSIGLDFARVRAVSFVTMLVEETSKRRRGLADKRKKIVQHDSRHAEIISRTGAASIVAKRWDGLASEILDVTIWQTFLVASRTYMNWIYYNNLLGVGIECALARIMEIDQIAKADIGVYAMVINDAIGFLLTRYQKEATLAEMQTHQQRLTELRKGFLAHDMRLETHSHCQRELGGGALHFQNFSYDWGTLHMHFGDLNLELGRAYAITGPNGCGKSTLFSILAACRQPMPLPAGLVAHGTVVFPSEEIVEIPQRPYHPLYIKPLAWLLNEAKEIEDIDVKETKEAEERIANLSAALRFDHANADASSSALSTEKLHSEIADWYSELSGGQRSKAELMRQVFLKERCPKVVLIDEAFAPLDPASKQLVQQRLKEFCSQSVLLVIYHTGDGMQCVSGNDFFDDNLRISNGSAKFVGLCPER